MSAFGRGRSSWRNCNLNDGACQVWDIRLEVRGGVSAEGAYIQALCQPRNGPDVPENVLCI